MPRDFFIEGPVLVKVKGGEHLSGGPIADLSELGLTSDHIQVSPVLYHHNVRPDDFGPNVPAEKLWMLAAAQIQMNLVHYDDFVLDTIEAESMAGGFYDPGIPGISTANAIPGTLPPAGVPMGNNLPLFASGNHYISLNLVGSIVGTQAGKTIRFPTSMLTEQPIILPLGTEKSVVRLTFTAIPYRNYSLTNQMLQLSGSLFVGNAIPALPAPKGDSRPTVADLSSSGAVLWDFEEDS